MQNVSEKYKQYLSTSLALSPRTRIVVDGTEYLSDVVMTSPRITHANTSFIGGFPSKTCTFALYNPNNTIDLVGKEVEVYKYFEIDGTVEYIKQGVFIPQAKDITNDITTKIYTVTAAQDKRQLLDVQYTSSLDWTTTHTGLEIVNDALKDTGITLESNTFAWASYSFNQPNFPANATKTEVISRIAEIGGEIAFINREGKVAIRGQVITGDTITGTRYARLTRENKYEVNTVILGKAGAEDNIIHPATINVPRVAYTINDNPYVDLDRSAMIEQVAQYIVGKSYTPFELIDFVDGYIYDLNDVINVVDKNGETFAAVILEYNNTSRIKSTVKAIANDTHNINYNLAGSSKKTLNEVKLLVDHNTNQIQGLVTKTDDLTAKTSETIQNAEEYTQTFYDSVIKEQIDELTGAINKEVETRSAGMRTSMDNDGNIVIELGSTSSPFTLELKNDGLYIYQNGELLQFFANSSSNAPVMRTDSLELLPFALKKRSNGHLSLLKVGD